MTFKINIESRYQYKFLRLCNGCIIITHTYFKKNHWKHYFYWSLNYYINLIFTLCTYEFVSTSLGKFVHFYFHAEIKNENLFVLKLTWMYSMGTQQILSDFLSETFEIFSLFGSKYKMWLITEWNEQLRTKENTNFAFSI